MGKICWNITASIGLMVFSQTASAALDSRVAIAVGHSVYLNLSQRDDPKNDARSIAGTLQDFSVSLNAGGARSDPAAGFEGTAGPSASSNFSTAESDIERGSRKTCADSLGLRPEIHGR